MVGPSLTFVLDPALVRTVLVADNDRYRRPDVQSGRTSRLTANGLLESEDSLWRNQRERLQPLFGRESLVKYADTIGTFTTDIAERWQPGDEVDLYEEMTTLARWFTSELRCSTSRGTNSSRSTRTSSIITIRFNWSDANGTGCFPEVPGLIC